MSANGLTYDTGALIAAERGDRLMWALHRAAITRGLVPTVPAGVLAEGWRGGPQHQLSRMLKGCSIEDLGEPQAREVGVLIARSGLSDTVDVAVVEGAVRRNDAVVTSNRAHIEQVADAAATRVPIHDVQLVLPAAQIGVTYHAPERALATREIGASRATRWVHQAGRTDDLFGLDDAAPICPACGVTALPGEAGEFVCENPDCPAFGEPV